MGKTLFIGDLHAMNSNMEDTGLILDLVNATAADPKNQVETIIFLGDIFHTHAMVRQEVAFFVREKILDIRKKNKDVSIFLLAGNHDGSSPHSVKTNAVRLVFGDSQESHLNVVDFGFRFAPFFLVPFYGSHKELLDECERGRDILPILVCHQTIKGAHYENKSLAPDGVDQDLIPFRKIISGHIHMEQTVGKTFYPGTPRALNANEYNESKGIWLFDNETEIFQKISTDSLVKLFHRYDINEANADSIVIDQSKWKAKDDIRFAISGTESFYKSMVEKYKEFSGKVRLIPNIRKELGKTVDVESEGTSMESALKHYVHNIYDADAQSRGKIWTTLERMIQN